MRRAIVARLNDSLWPGAALWVLLYISDYAFTIACARMYQAGVGKILIFEGSYELTPAFQQDVDSLRIFSPRFAIALLWAVLMLAAIWWLSRLVWPEAYPLALGALVLVQLSIHVRHVRNFLLFRRTLAGQGAHGRVEYGRPLILQLSAVEMLGFGVIFLVGSAITGSLFLLGGAASCLALAAKHFRLARMAASAKRPPSAEGEARG